MATALATSQATVGLTAVQISGDRPTRKGGVFMNISQTASASMAFDGQTAVLGYGVTLMPGGGAFTMDANNVTTGAISCIASEPGAMISFQEFV